jgi:hypothetical protein
MTNRRSVANVLQGIPFFVRSANIDIIITDIIGGTNFTPLRLRIHILNRRGGSNLQDEYSVYMASPN